MGKLATSPLPYRGDPPLQSGGAKSAVAHEWANWLPHPCRIGDPHRYRAGGKIRSGPRVGKLATSPLPYRGWGKIRSGPQVGKLATSPLPYRGSRPLQSGGQNQKWPTSGQIGYLTPAVSGIPTATERGAKSEVAHEWANWLPHPCRIGDPDRFRAGGKIRSGPQVGEMATSPLPYRGSPPLQKKNRTNDVCASRNTLKTPPRTILKKGGGFQNPPRYRISQNPPPPPPGTPHPSRVCKPLKKRLDQIIVLCACCPSVQWLGLRAKVPSSLRHCTRSAVACWAVGWQTCSKAHARTPVGLSVGKHAGRLMPVRLAVFL